MRSLIGRRVLNVHRQSCNYTEAYRLSHNGVVVDVSEGVNPIIYVRFRYDPSHVASMAPQDLAFVATWPLPESRVSAYLNLIRNL